MIPIGDRNPTRNFVFINYLLLLANIVVFVYELQLGTRLDGFISRWGVRSPEVIGLLSGQLALLQPVLVKSLVSMFLHGGWLHIIFNMLFLWIFGDNVEDNFGSLPYLLFYLLCGVGAVLAQALLTPRADVPSIGASGAISGVLAAYLLLYPRASIRAILPIPILFLFSFFVPAWLMIIIWFGGQLLNSYAALTSAAEMTGGVAYGAHVGGFVAGLLLTFVFRKRQLPPRYESYQQYYHQ
ncbi:MAG: rhomboid family intramembrane serine protease [Chloroflexi bacterium SZAS-1]|jgi:membrane associated rhomboid family serine protease|nr:rhomboid family intramembrane serine protease [Chloroflexi bacterium SZAS-1]